MSFKPPSFLLSVTGTFLLAAAVNGVIKVAIDDENGNFQLPFSLDGLVGASDIAWDSKEGLIFWSDMRKRTISVAHVTVSVCSPQQSSLLLLCA